MFANANAMTTVGRRSLEALRLQPLGKPPQCFLIVFCIKSWYDNNWIVFLQVQTKQSTNTIKTVPRCKVTKKVSKDKRFS